MPDPTCTLSGLVLLEALTGQAPDGDRSARRPRGRARYRRGRRAGPVAAAARELLRRASAEEPAARFAGMAELRKAIDALLFSGDFTPTTFDLAFFMHTLFRDEVERDARAVDDARAGDYREFLPEEPRGPRARARAPALRRAHGLSRPPRKRLGAADRGSRAERAGADAPERACAEGRARPSAHARPRAAGPGPDASQSRLTRVAREAGARDAASRLSLGGGAATARGIGGAASGSCWA